jgi:hypothetical protein
MRRNALKARPTLEVLEDRFCLSTSPLLAATPPVEGAVGAAPHVKVFDGTRATAAQVDFFLKLSGIDGEATDDKHKREIELLSFSANAARAAQVDYYLKVDTIDGDVTGAAFAQGLDLLSWGEEADRTSAHGSGGGAGKVQMQDFHFVMI